MSRVADEIRDWAILRGRYRCRTGDVKESSEIRRIADEVKALEAALRKIAGLNCGDYAEGAVLASDALHREDTDD